MLTYMLTYLLTYSHGFLQSTELLHIQGSNLIPTEHQIWSLHGFLHGILPITRHGSNTRQSKA